MSGRLKTRRLIDYLGQGDHVGSERHDAEHGGGVAAFRVERHLVVHTDLVHAEDVVKANRFDDPSHPECDTGAIRV